MIDRTERGFYSPAVAARVARIRPQNFQAWAKANLLHPARVQIGKRVESSYSYFDLLLIRLIVRLREKGIQARKIKRALDTISDMSGGDPHAWLKATIYIDSGLIVALLPGKADWNPIAASQGSQKMALIFFPELIEELKRELVPERFDHVEIDPRILGGAPIIRNTRIPTQAIVMAAESGQDPRTAYPTLTDQQVREAQAYEQFLEAA
jgi:uncharacterized protein (DUF433 family)